MTLEPLSFYATPSVSGGGSLSYNGCSGCWTGSGCIQVAVQAGYELKAEVNVADWISFGGGGKAYAEVSSKLCFTCTCGGCNFTLSSCVSGALRAYAYVEYKGWIRMKKWTYQYTAAFQTCTPPYSLNSGGFIT